MTRWSILVAFGAATTLVGCVAAPLAPVPPEPPDTLPRVVAEGMTMRRWIRVSKHDRRLVLYDDTQPIRTYPIVLGEDPVGAKLHEGDNRTPEGEYHIAAKYPHPSWSRFMLLDYPTPMNRDVLEWVRQSGALPGSERGGPGVGGQVGIHGTFNDAM